MKYVYFIGGPWDLTKRVFDEKAGDVLYVAELKDPQRYRTDPDTHNVEVIAERHTYYIRRAPTLRGDTYIAIHESLG